MIRRRSTAEHDTVAFRAKLSATLERAKVWLAIQAAPFS